MEVEAEAAISISRVRQGASARMRSCRATKVTSIRTILMRNNNAERFNLLRADDSAAIVIGSMWILDDNVTHAIKAIQEANTAYPPIFCSFMNFLPFSISIKQGT
jgi:hypothetical protein